MVCRGFIAGVGDSGCGPCASVLAFVVVQDLC